MSSSITENNGKPDQIQIELQELNNGLKYIQNEQDYMIQREKIHRQSKQNRVFAVLQLNAYFPLKHNLVPISRCAKIKFKNILLVHFQRLPRCSFSRL